MDPLWLALDVASTAEISEHSRRAQLTGWRQFTQWAQSEGVCLLAPEDTVGERYLRYLESKYQAPSTVINRLSQARNLYKHWRQLELTQAEPFQLVQPPPNQPATRRRLFSQEEIDLLLRTEDLETRALIALGLCPGLKASSIIHLSWEQIDLTERLILVKDTSELITLDARTHRHLLALFNHNQALSPGGTGTIFPSLTSESAVTNRLRAHCRAIGIKPRSWLTLRNTSGTQRTQHNPPRELQRQMEFTSVRSIQYLDQCRRFEEGEPVVSPRPRRKMLEKHSGK